MVELKNIMYEYNGGTSVSYAFEYFIGLMVFGLLWWMFNGILPEIGVVSVQGDVFRLSQYLWEGSVVVYLIFGMFYLWRRIKEWKILR